MTRRFLIAWLSVLSCLGLAVCASAVDPVLEEIPPPLSVWDASDDRIDAPAQAALVRLSNQGPELATEVWLMLKAVKSRALAGIQAQGGGLAALRARALEIPSGALLAEGQVARCVVLPEGARALLVYADGVADDPHALDSAILAGFRACPFAPVDVFVTRAGERVARAEVVVTGASQGIRTEPCRTTTLGRCRFALPWGADYEVSAKSGDRTRALPLDSLPVEGAGLRFDLADPEPQAVK